MDIIKTIATKSGYSQKDIKEVLGYLEETIEEGLRAGEKFRVAGLNFEVVDTAQRNGVNPSTGERIVIPAGKRGKVKLSAKYKRAVKGE